MPSLTLLVLIVQGAIFPVAGFTSLTREPSSP